MRSAIASYWNYGNAHCGVEVTHVQGRMRYFAVTAKKKKGEFNDFGFQSGNSFADLVEEIGKNRHAHLVLNMDGVLIKEVPNEKDFQKAVSKAFPGVSLTDFYSEVIQGVSTAYVAVARKDTVEELLREAADAGLGVLSFQLGFGSLKKIASLLASDTAVTPKYEFQLEDGNIRSFLPGQENQNAYKLEDIQVPSSHLLATSGLLGYLSHSDTFNDERNKQLTKDYLEKNFFRKGLAAAVVLILISLLVNFFFFTDYRKEYQQLTEQVEVASEQRNRLQAKTESVEKKEFIVENILNSGHSKSSYYLNRLVSQRPGSLLFSNIEYQPLLKNVRPDKEIVYDSDVVVLKGDSYDKEAFSAWIQELESMDWIAGVTVLQYGTSRGKGNYFEIKLALLDDAKE